MVIEDLPTADALSEVEVQEDVSDCEDDDSGLHDWDEGAGGGARARAMEDATKS